ncbi:MAG: cytosine deaminase [Burkholderiales bacterium]|nr:MAG: cytosine deaminase [Burkholderiales bacterium]
MATDLLIRNARPLGGPATDLLIRSGRIVERATGLSAPGVPIEDAGGKLVLPGLVEAHTHLDKTLLGMGWHPHGAGPRIIDKIDHERALKGPLDIDPARQSARQALQSVGFGTTHIRTHLDIDTDYGLWAVEGIAATRERLRPVVDIDRVAFPQSGLLRRPGTLELMDRALAMGVEVVGGLDPCAIDRDPKGHLDAVFALSQKHGRPIDIHLHEPGEMGAFSLELIFERIRALGLRGQVTVSHAFCLGAPDRDLVDPLIAQLAELDVAIMTTGPASRPAPPVARLLAAGIRVCSGSDGIRDTWSPYGNGDMLERAMLVGLRNNFRRDEDVELAFHTCTRGGADAMRIAGYGLEPGCAADLVIVPGETVTDAVVSRPTDRVVVKRGVVVARGGVCTVVAP